MQTDDGLSSASISLHFHCPCTALQMSTVGVKPIKKKKRKHQVTGFVFPSTDSNSFPHYPKTFAAPSDFKFKSVKLITCVFKVTENTGGMSQQALSYPMGAGLCLWD